MTDVAKHVAAYERNQSPSTVTKQEYQSVQTDLQHNHLPRLADYGLIEYDRRTGDVCFDEPSQIFMLLLGFCHLIEGSLEQP